MSDTKKYKIVKFTRTIEVFVKVPEDYADEDLVCEGCEDGEFVFNHPEAEDDIDNAEHECYGSDDYCWDNKGVVTRETEDCPDFEWGIWENYWDDSE